MLIIDLAHEVKLRFDSSLVEKCFSYENYEMKLLEIDCRQFHRCYYRSFNDAIPFVGDHPYCVKPILEQIPIYLVTTKQAKQTIKVAHWGRVESVVVPEDKYVEGIINEENHDDDFIKLQTIDLFGLYQRQILNSTNGNYGIENIKPSIFIWVDKIYEYVGKEIEKHNYKEEDDYDDIISNFYNTLTTLVILHELMHAIMDNMLLGTDNPNNLNHRTCFNKYFDKYKEESLANAMALKLMERMIDEEEWNFIIDFVKHQPDEYALGLEYLSLSVLYYAELWVRHKDGHQFVPKVMSEWLSFVKGAKPLDSKQLKALEDGLWNHERLFEFNGKFYIDDDVCVEAIKQYAKKNISITRQELHNAFPDSLNSNFEAIIDYPENNEFHNKKDGNTRCIFNENIIHCKDGDVVVCDYWHTDDMPGFVKNAGNYRIRIKIETF